MAIGTITIDVTEITSRWDRLLRAVVILLLPFAYLGYWASKGSARRLGIVSGIVVVGAVAFGILLNPQPDTADSQVLKVYGMLGQVLGAVSLSILFAFAGGIVYHRASLQRPERVAPTAVLAALICALGSIPMTSTLQAIQMDLATTNARLEAANILRTAFLDMGIADSLTAAQRQNIEDAWDLALRGATGPATQASATDAQ